MPCVVADIIAAHQRVIAAAIQARPYTQIATVGIYAKITARPTVGRVSNKLGPIPISSVVAQIRRVGPEADTEDG